ncbi:MAG: hypothetical protein LW688_10145 [Cryomorphaceae bacterium]|jgi:hypothetical protein|nr:hypothetical protein [Cryomorphaceae bacterium]
MKTKTILTLAVVIALLASCAQVRPDKFDRAYTSKKHLRALMKESSKYNTSSLMNEALSDSVYTYSEVERLQSEDAKYIREHWTEEQKKDFLENYTFSVVIIDGDTLKHNNKY